RYMQLTEAEASFRALKSELSIRPLFHQLEPRVKAHVNGGLPRLCSVDHSEATTAAPASDCTPAVARRSPQRATILGEEGSVPVVHPAERRHCVAHDGWPRDPPASDYGTHQ